MMYSILNPGPSSLAIICGPTRAEVETPTKPAVPTIEPKEDPGSPEPDAPERLPMIPFEPGKEPGLPEPAQPGRRIRTC